MECYCLFVRLLVLIELLWNVFFKFNDHKLLISIEAYISKIMNNAQLYVAYMYIEWIYIPLYQITMYSTGRVFR